MSTPSHERRFRPGDLVAGRYRLETALGAGGFGAVYRATQVSSASASGAWSGTPGLAVALKLLHPEVVADAESRERFRREALVAQRLVHPNIVRLHDFGEAEGGVPYIAFEILHGKSLDVVLREERALPHPRVMRITIQVLKALMAAHAAGIVHRDIKPANVFLCDFQGEPDFVKVLDLGIAKSTGATSMAEMTRTGQIVGTPAYMSPELLRANAASPAADIYALGLTMIRMISGELAYKGTPAEVIHGQLSHDPVPLPPLAAQSPLASVIRRAAEKNPSLRYTSAAEMLAEVQRTTSAGASFAAESIAFRPPPVEAPPTAQPFVAPTPQHFPSQPTRPPTPAPPSPPPQTSMVVAPQGPSPSPSHPSLPSHPSYASQPSHPSLPLPSRPSRAPTSPMRLVLLGVTLTLGAGALGIGVASVLLDRSDARTMVPLTAPKSVAAPKKNATNDEPAPAGSDDLTLQSQLAWNPPPDAKSPEDSMPTADSRLVRKRLDDDGWQLDYTTDPEMLGYVLTTSMHAVRGSTDLGVTVMEYPTVEQANKDMPYLTSKPAMHTAIVLLRRTFLSVQCNSLSQAELFVIAKKLGAPPAL